MGREVRHVPENWQHPKKPNGNYKPLFEGPFSERLAKWQKEKAEWQMRDECETYEEWAGNAPQQSEYMPEWPESECTHIQMYEDTTEGNPISPVMKTPEELARWLADNNASAFGDMTATYDEWLSMINGGYSVSGIIVNGELKSGVAGCV